MVFYDGQDVNFNEKYEKMRNMLINMNISKDDINFIKEIIQITPLTIGCSFYTFNLHPKMENTNIVYEIDLSYLDFYDYSLKGIIQIEKVNFDCIRANNIDYYNKKKANIILLPKKYYINFENECIANEIIENLSVNNISLCNYLKTKYNHNDMEIESFLINRDNNIVDSIYDFIDVLFANEENEEEIKMEFFDNKYEETLDIIFNNSFCQLNGNVKKKYNHKKRKR